MVHLTCDCLNIQIHTKGSMLLAVDNASLNLTNDELNDSFFQGGVVTASLDLAGVTKQVSCLVKLRIVGDWNIHLCINCHMDVFAAHFNKGLDYILICKRLQSDSTVINYKMKSKDYSPLYKIILPEISCLPELSPIYPIGSIYWNPHQSEALEAAQNLLQNQLTKYIRTEQEESEEKIRCYVKQQREAFNALQKRAQEDKDIITNVLFKSEKNKFENSITEAMIDSNGLTPPMTPVNITSNEISTPLLLNNNKETREWLTSEEQDEVVNQVTMPPMIRQRPQSFGRPLHGKIAIRKKVVINPPRIAKSLDMDGIFQLEGVEEELAPPFYHSEDDYTDGDDLSDKSSDEVFIPVKKDAFHFPMSLPVDVPIHSFRSQQLHLHQTYDEIDEDEKISLPDDPAQVAASFKALAKNVRLNDTTEMFGDLPRPRLNTNN